MAEQEQEPQQEQGLQAPSVELVCTHGKFMLTKTGVVVMEDTSFEEWQTVTQWVQSVSDAVMFWIGDLLAYGEQSFGERYAQAVELTGYSEQTLTNAVYVARHVPIARRRPSVSFAHHSEVAALSPDDQDRWLLMVETEKTSRDALRAKIRDERAERTGKPAKPLWLVVSCKDAADLERLKEQMEREGRSTRLQ